MNNIITIKKKFKTPPIINHTIKKFQKTPIWPFWQPPAHQTHLGSCASGQRIIVVNNTDTYGLFHGEETMTHPSPGGSISADVSKSFLVVPVWGAEGNFLNGLVNYHTLKMKVKHKYMYLVSYLTYSAPVSFLHTISSILRNVHHYKCSLCQNTYSICMYIVLSVLLLYLFYS